MIISKPYSFLFGLFLVGGLAACSKQDVGPSDDEILQSNIADIQAYATSNNLGGSSTASGVYYAVTQPASASAIAPANGQEVEYTYKLYQLLKPSGSSAPKAAFVDSTYATTSAYSYIVSSNYGLVEGLLRMHEGERGLILLPSAYAFGRDGYQSVQPNSPVLIDILLKRVRTEEQQINEYLTANKLTPTEVTTSGLRFIRTVTNTSGATPTPTQTLILRYQGQLLRSTTAFDGTTGTNTFSTTTSGLIPGFAEGISKLRVGEKATLVFPSSLGYGSTGVQATPPRQSIPPYAPLRFDVELVSVQ